jgi:2-polyprenyl-3-methyl-5-hydroxy-6-metoxy-1,4-benzoquinol methylase
MLIREENSVSKNVDQHVYITCKDHTVSGETFSLILDKEKDMLVTSPKPSSESLPSYYESAAYISHTDSKNSFSDKLYHQVKSFMLQTKLKWIEKYFPKKGSILDIGAGTGDFLALAKSQGWEVNGIEPNSLARNNAQEKGIGLSASISEIKNQKFDVITMWHVLEHVYDLDAQIKELKNLLSDNGVLIIAVPNYKSYDAKHYKEFWAAYDVPRHLYHFSQTSIRSIFKSVGFSLQTTKPLIFDSFYVSLLSEKYKSGTKNFFKAFYIGLISNLKAKRSSEYSSLVYFLQKSS